MAKDFIGDGRLMRRVGRDIVTLKNPAKFFKTVGGGTYVVMHRGRWHYVGNHGTDGAVVEQRMAIWHQSNADRGTVRVGTPKVVQDLWKRYGATPATLRDHLPHFLPCNTNE